MKKRILIIVCLLSISIGFAQKQQRIAYIDMEYILENFPEYTEAQNTLNNKVSQWKNLLDKESRSIEVLSTDLENEKSILTQDLIEEREEEIVLKKEELRRLEELYFGPKGDIFQFRKQLVKPLQDQVYNSVQKIALRKKYDFVFDKSSELVVIYSNKKHDISELVLKTIKNVSTKSKKLQEGITKKQLSEAKKKQRIEKRKARLEELKRKREAYKNRNKNKKESNK